MEELGLKTGKPKMWLRRVLVILFALGLAGALFGVLQIWAFGRFVLVAAVFIIFVIGSVISVPGSAVAGFLAGCFLADWADLEEDWVAPVFGVLAFVGYVIGAVLFLVFVAPGWAECFHVWLKAGAY